MDPASDNGNQNDKMDQAAARDSTAIPAEEHGDDAVGTEAQMNDLAYDILRTRARHLMATESPGHTLQATALVHEAYLRLADTDGDRWQSRAHFLAVASRAMRRILVDHARTRSRDKRGNGWHRVTLNDDLPAFPAGSLALLDMIHFDRCLGEFEQKHERMGRVAEMKLFGGMTCAEIAESLALSQRTIEGDWAFARRWLSAAIADERDV